MYNYYLSISDYLPRWRAVISSSVVNLLTAAQPVRMVKTARREACLTSADEAHRERWYILDSTVEVPVQVFSTVCAWCVRSSEEQKGPERVVV